MPVRVLQAYSRLFILVLTREKNPQNNFFGCHLNTFATTRVFACKQVTNRPMYNIASAVQSKVSVYFRLPTVRRDLKKKRYEAEGAKEYREANRRSQKAVKNAKEDWIGTQCKELETCLNKKQ